MRFEEADEGWTEKRLTQINAAQLPGVCPRTFRLRVVDSVSKSFAPTMAATSKVAPSSHPG